MAAVRSSRASMIVGLAFACAAAPGCGFSKASPGSGSPASSHGEVALQVERSGGDIRVTWDRGAELVAKADEGVLTIEDGQLPRRELRLNSVDLHAGSVLYTPATNAVRFRLALAVATSALPLSKGAAEVPENSRSRIDTSGSVEPERVHASGGPPPLLTGIASYFHGDELTAMHPTLPVGSLVRVTNLANGKSVVVRIRRGGSANGVRAVNVSSAAAEKLGFQRAGIAKVRLDRE